MTVHEPVSRRSVLRKGAVATGAAIFGGTTVVGRAVAQDEQAGLAAQIESHGHYSWFPLGAETWGRSATPYDMQDGDSRWLAQPESDGSVRCLGKNLGGPLDRNAGFDVHLGELGAIDTVAVTSRTLQTSRTTGPAVLRLGLWLDKDENGEFWEWDARDGFESWAGFGEDAGGGFESAASGELLIDGDTLFGFSRSYPPEATLAELQEGTVEDISGETPAALHVGVTTGGKGTDEIVVEDMRVQRS